LNLAVITVANGAASISNANITDKRVQTALSTNAASNNTGWTGLGYTPNTVAYNGQRSYTLTFNTVDLTGTVSPGYRLRTTRTVAAPTQCTSLNGTTQYWVKTSPAAMTFTNNFVVDAYVKLTSYPVTASGIVSRNNGTSGWILLVEATGQITLGGYNGGLGNSSKVTSYQSIPLNKWVRVTAQLDMTNTTNDGSNNYVMVDGINVPAAVVRAGTNPTALIQAGNLEIGSFNAGGFLPGKIAQVAIFNAKVTQAQMQTYMSQSYLGTETSLISAYSFNNSTTDLNVTNANNLAVGGGAATATTADSPFGTQGSGLISSTLDYGIVQSAVFSTNTTMVVQVPEGCAIPTSAAGVSAVSYSGQASPYGFPRDAKKWEIATVLLVDETITVSSVNQWFASLGARLTVPVGAWNIGYQFSIVTASGAATATYGSTLLSPTVPVNNIYNQDLSTPFAVGDNSVTDLTIPVKRDILVNLSNQATYVQYTQIGGIGTGASWKIRGTQGMVWFFARNSLL
jgi:hypothetical protein